jgi:hypothetical protein
MWLGAGQAAAWRRRGSFRALARKVAARPDAEVFPGPGP